MRLRLFLLILFSLSICCCSKLEPDETGTWYYEYESFDNASDAKSIRKVELRIRDDHSYQWSETLFAYDGKGEISTSSNIVETGTVTFFSDYATFVGTRTENTLMYSYNPDKPIASNISYRIDRKSEVQLFSKTHLILDDLSFEKRSRK